MWIGCIHAFVNEVFCKPRTGKARRPREVRSERAASLPLLERSDRLLKQDVEQQDDEVARRKIPRPIEQTGNRARRLGALHVLGDRVDRPEPRRARARVRRPPARRRRSAPRPGRGRGVGGGRLVERLRGPRDSRGCPCRFAWMIGDRAAGINSRPPPSRGANLDRRPRAEGGAGALDRRFARQATRTPLRRSPRWSAR